MKIAIALDETLGQGFLANASACIASGLFHNEQDLIGTEIDAQHFTYIPITKIPILIVKKNNRDWKDLLNRAKKNKLKYMVFTREGQSTISYEEYIQRVKGKSIEEVTIIGIGVLGEDKLVQKFCGDLPLLR
ncbi:MAG: DUF2000 domain-containing protein [Nanoarchaeota archaeon]|nr:DUF2000 domain-containing protein [Nanoarchaeota archaeon]